MIEISNVIEDDCGLADDSNAAVDNGKCLKKRITLGKKVSDEFDEDVNYLDDEVEADNSDEEDFDDDFVDSEDEEDEEEEDEANDNDNDVKMYVFSHFFADL
jgi:hypothetical protein